MSGTLVGCKMHLARDVYFSVPGTNKTVIRKDLDSQIREKLEPAAGLFGLFLYIQTTDVPL